MRPTGQDAVKFLERWDSSHNDVVTKAQLLRDYGVGLRQARGWVDTLRHEGIECPIILESKHKNQFIKLSPANPAIYTLKTEGHSSVAGVVQDPHHPFQDKIVLNLILNFFIELQPDYIFIPGDWLDVYQLSRFNKDPDRANDLQRDIDSGVAGLKRFRDGCSNSKFIFEDGNHEDRLRKFLWSNGRELSCLRALDPDDLLGFNELEIDRVPKQSLLLVNDVFQVEHGDVVSKHSSWTAKAMYERRGGCGMCGHSHRGGSYYKHDSDYFGWWENFCTCDLHPEWVKNPNWMHGFSLIHFIGKRFFVEQIPIINNKFVYGGKVYQ